MSKPIEDAILFQILRDHQVWRKSPWNSEESVDAIPRVMEHVPALLEEIARLKAELAKEGK